MRIHARALSFPRKEEQGGAPPHQEINTEQKNRKEFSNDSVDLEFTSEEEMVED